MGGNTCRACCVALTNAKPFLFLAASYSQVKTVPFLVLARVISQATEAPKEYLKRLTDVVFDTCMAVYKQSPSIREDLLDDKDIKFLKSPLNRTIDAVANLSVFMAQLLCAIASGDVDLTPSNVHDLYLAIIEEVRSFSMSTVQFGILSRFSLNLCLLQGFRRQAAFSNRSDDNDFLSPQDIMQLLGIEPLNHIDPYVEEVRHRMENVCKSQLPDYRQKFLAMLPAIDTGAVSPSQNMLSLKPSDVRSPPPQNTLERGSPDDAVWKRVAGTAKKWYAEAIHGPLFQFMLDKISVDLPLTKWASWPLDVKITLTLQSLCTVKNSFRRQYISDGLYLDPFLQSSAFLDRQFHKEVKAKIDSGIEAVTKAYQDSKFAQVADQFLQANDLDFAAGAFLGSTLGVSLPFFYKPLLQRVFPLSVEKMRMLTSGHHRNVPLLRDADKWQIGRRNTIGFLRVHHHLVTLEDAIVMFPRHERNIRLWYQIYEW